MARLPSPPVKRSLALYEADVCGSVWRGGAPVRRAVDIPPLLNFRSVAGGEFREGQGVELGHALVNLHFQNVFAEFLEAGDDSFGIRKLRDSGFPGVGDVGFVDERGIGHVDHREFQANFGGELIAFVAVIGVGRAGGERLAVKFFFVGVAAEVVFFFEQQPIFAAKKIGGGKAGDAAADDDDVGFCSGGGKIEMVAVADLVADFEMFAIDEGRAARFGS